MAELSELLLKLIGEEEQIAPNFLQHVLNRGMERIPDVIQTGMKKGQTLKAHVQNVICFSYQLADILEVDDSDKVNLIAAAYVHDLNKFPEFAGKSYSAIATSENVETILNNMLTDYESHAELSTELIVSLIRAHSGHLHCDGDGLFAVPKHPSRDKLIAALQAADTLDLSHHFHERDQKEKALRILNGQLSDLQFDYTWHFFSDNRGIYTNLIQNTIVELYRKQGAIPLLFYPEGVWYLIKKGESVSVSAENTAKNLQLKIDMMSLEDTSKLLRDAKGVGFKFTQNPILLGLDAEKIMQLLVQAVVKADDKSYKKKYEKLKEESPKKCLKRYTDWMAKSDERQQNLKQAKKGFETALNQAGMHMDFKEDDEIFKKLPAKKKDKIVKASSEYQNALKEIELEKQFKVNMLWESFPTNLFSSELNVLRAGKLVGSLPYLLIEYLNVESETAWNLSAEIAGISCHDYPELQFYDGQSDRGYRTAVILHENGIGFETIRQRYTAFIESLIRKSSKDIKSQISPEIVDYIAAQLRIKNDSFKTDDSFLKNYIQSNHKQCCHCGSGTAFKWTKDDLPSGIKLQLFSNRLKGGGGDPVRNVCEVCRQSFLVEKLVHEVYDNPYYLHLIADGGEFSSHAEPSIFIEAVKNGLMALQHSDCRSFLIQPNKTIKEYLEQHIPKIYGEPKKKFGVLIPKFSESIGGQISIGINSPGDNDGVRFVFALFHLLFFVNRFNLRGIMSKSSIPPLKPIEFNTIFIDHIPLSFNALIPENNLNAEQAHVLWNKFSSLYGLRNTYDAIDDKEIPKIAKTLYDETGLELFYHLHKSYSKSKQTKDREVKPWKNAWQYLTPFIQEEKLMPIKQLAEIALKHHFHGQSWKETSQAKPLDLAFDALSKHREPENEEDLNMVILHDVTRGLERLSDYDSLGKVRYEAVKDFVTVFFEQIFKGRYKADKNKMMKDQKRIRAAFLGYLNGLRNNAKTE